MKQTILKRTKVTEYGEAQYHCLFMNNPMPMWVIDVRSFRFLDVNDAAVDLYGYSREEFIRMTALDIRPPEEKERYKRANHPVHIHPGQYNWGTWKHLKKDGGIIYVEIAARDIIFDEAAARLILATDITEKMKMAEKQSLYTAMINSSEDGIISKTPEGAITSWNRGAEMLFGYTEKEAIGQNISMLIPAENSNEEQEIIEKIKKGQYVQHYESVPRENLADKISTTLLQVKSSVSMDLIKQYSDQSGRENFIKTATVQVMSAPEYQLC